MPNKRLKSKLRQKSIFDNNSKYKSAHVQDTIKKLIEKSKENLNEIEEDAVLGNLKKPKKKGQTIRNNKIKKDASVAVGFESTSIANDCDDSNNKKMKKNNLKIDKKSKKNKYLFLAHPELKKNIANLKDDLKLAKKFVLEKEIVEKLPKKIKKSETATSKSKKTENNSSSSSNIHKSLWIIEKCTSSEDENEESKPTKIKKKAKKIKLDNASLNVKKCKEILADGTIVETFTAVEDDEPKEVEKGDEEESEADDNDDDDDVKKEEEEVNQKLEPVETKSKVKSEIQLKLQASRFRFLNEMLYTQSSESSFDYFKKDNDAFSAYHSGFQSQTIKWPKKPLDIIAQSIKSRPSNLIVADFGCGEAKLAQSINNKVHSFDFVALNDLVTPCDMKSVPIESKSCDIAVFCLSLMGNNIIDFICEAHRILKNNGQLKIAEVASRFENVQRFVRDVESIGFKCVQKDDNNKEYFYYFDFNKTSVNVKSKPKITLQACLYKKR